jgi:hypothetical protein
MESHENTLSVASGRNAARVPGRPAVKIIFSQAVKEKLFDGGGRACLAWMQVATVASLEP